MHVFMLVCAVAFFYLQNRYYGWNGYPQSDSEVLADGISLLMLGLAFY